MADQQPEKPAAGVPDETPAVPEPTHVGGDPADPTPDEGTTAARWSGSAVVPPHVPRRPWWSRRRAEDRPPAPADPWAGRDDWAATPAVDPWADQDTPWQAELPFPEAMPPTRIDGPMPPTQVGAPLPPTRLEPPLPPTRTEHPAPPPSAPAPTPAVVSPPPAPAVVSPPAAASPPAAPGRRRWGRNRAKQAPAAPANRLPVQPRPPVAPAPQSRVVLTPARPAPPPWQAPAQVRPPAAPPGRRPPHPPRRKRRWPRRLFLFTLVSLVCCCGVPGYLAWPAASQYPVTADLPSSIADLNLRDDGASRRAVERLTEELSDTALAQGDVFGGVYADGNGKKVTVFGTTGLRLTPQEDVEAEIAHLADGYRIKNIEPYDLGETGLHERCGVGRSGANAVVVCAWADHGSLGTVLFTRRSVAESAELTGRVRSSVLVRR